MKASNNPSQQQSDNHDDHDHDDALQPQIWTYSVLAASIPLFYMGNWVVGWCFVLMGILYVGFGSDWLVTKLSPADQLRIQYNIWSADDVVQDLKRRIDASSASPTDESHDELRTTTLAALTALAKKYKPKQPETRQVKGKLSSPDDKSPTVEQAPDDAILPRLFQEAAYACLTSSILERDDKVVSDSLALLALVTQHAVVRERYRPIHQTGVCGLNVLVRCMARALERAQAYEDGAREHDGAELQRKACLLLGSLADGNTTTTDLARHVVEQGGLQAILKAVAWFRFHEPVANWGLWAVFILCYENSVNKVSLLELQGLSTVLDTMKHHGTSVEVTRHGTAILFDLLRENSNDASSNHPNLDVWKVRNLALTAGLHERLVHVLHEFSQESHMDILMMAREMLIGTGYQGDIPNVNVSSVR